MTEQKRVSFKVAKAIKEAGYPQDIHNGEYYYAENGLMWEYDSETYELYDDPIYCVCPYIMQVWLWLWREKHITITSQLWYDGLDKWGSIIETATFYDEMYDYTDPEEAIIAAIEYIVDNNLVK